VVKEWLTVSRRFDRWIPPAAAGMAPVQANLMKAKGPVKLLCGATSTPVAGRRLQASLIDRGVSKPDDRTSGRDGT
jgi:hypothetical protein